MSIQAILSRTAAVPVGSGAQPSASAPAGGPSLASTQLPEDHVVVSDQARSLASRAAGGVQGDKPQPELQLSPEKLRQLVSGDNG